MILPLCYPSEFLQSRGNQLLQRSVVIRVFHPEELAAELQDFSSEGRVSKRGCNMQSCVLLGSFGDEEKLGVGSIGHLFQKSDISRCCCQLAQALTSPAHISTAGYYKPTSFRFIPVPPADSSPRLLSVPPTSALQVITSPPASAWFVNEPQLLEGSRSDTNYNSSWSHAEILSALVPYETYETPHDFVSCGCTLFCPHKRRFNMVPLNSTFK
ncbi:hypothetical protein ACLOJK_015453 [Asimina triloba]